MTHRVRFRRQKPFLERDPLSLSKGQYALLNESIQENQLNQNQNVNNFDVQLKNKKGKNIILHCNTPEKKRLHPACVKEINPENVHFEEKKKEREEKIQRREDKIKRFFQQYHQRVGTPNTNPTYQNDYVQFVKNIRNDPNQRWIYESYLYAGKKEEDSREYIYNRNKQTKTQRQQTHLRGMFSGLKEDIENAFVNETLNQPYLINIQQIFEDIDLINKIDFEFNFEQIKFKLEMIKKKLQRYRMNMFMNESILNEMIKGEKLLEEIFTEYSNPGIYRFLIQTGILNHDLIYEYNLQFTHSYREAAFHHLIEWVKIYKNRIYFIYDLLINPQSSYIQNPTRETLLHTILQYMILKPLEKYLFYTNYGLINYFQYKEEILAISFEDFYYLHLKQNILFMITFLECIDLPIPQTITNQGVQGFIYDTEDGNIMKVSQDKSAYEKSFFEFFKQCCIHSLIPEYTVPSYKIIIGPTKCGVKMKKIDGLTYLRHYVNFILQNKDKPDFENQKYHENIQFLQKFGEIIRECQQFNFVHRDLNIRNIMIDTYGKYYLIDFDYTIITIHNMFILNYRKQLSLENMFEKTTSMIQLSSFAKSIDLFRIMIHYFMIYFYLTKHKLQFLKYISENNISLFKKNPDIFKANPILLNSLHSIFFGTDCISILKKYGEKAFLLANQFKFRHEVYLKCIETLQWRSRAKLDGFYNDWIQPFIPHNFLYLLSQISMENPPPPGPMKFYRPPGFNKTKSPILNLPRRGGKKKSPKKKTTKKTTTKKN